jgi:hypothetical protein
MPPTGNIVRSVCIYSLAALPFFSPYAPECVKGEFLANFVLTEFSEVGWSNEIVMWSGRHLASAGTLHAKGRWLSCARLKA